jgi:hypothetical protein
MPLQGVVSSEVKISGTKVLVLQYVSPANSGFSSTLVPLICVLLQGVVSSGVVGRDGRVGHFVGSRATIKQYGLAIARRSVQVCAVKK